jgi:hypothetical protein
MLLDDHPDFSLTRACVLLSGERNREYLVDQFICLCEAIVSTRFSVEPRKKRPHHQRQY